MKRWVTKRLAAGVIALPLTASCFSRSTQYNITDAAYGAYNARQFSSKPISTLLNGGKLGYAVRKIDSPVTGFIDGGYFAGEQGFDHLRVFSFGAGGRYAAFRKWRVEAGGLGFLEFQHARLDRFRNGNELFALGIGGYAELRVVSRVALTVTLSAHAFFDGTPPTTCNDGSSSFSTGQGTCSHHDGIAYYNDKLGGGGALDAVVGLSVWFDGADGR